MAVYKATEGPAGYFLLDIPKNMTQSIFIKAVDYGG